MNVLIAVNFFCQYCKRFSVTCNFCGNEKCRNCCAFERSKELLLNSGDKMSQKCIANFINDYLGMREVTACFFNCKISKELKKEENSFAVKSYQKCKKKNRPQVVNKT